MSTPPSSINDLADVAEAAAANVPPLPAAGDNPASFKPKGIFVHLLPMTCTSRSRVQVRLGNGEDCPIVQPPATVWFSPEGRLMAVATPRTDSDAEEEEDKKKDEDMDTESEEEPIDVKSGDDDTSGAKNKPEPEVITIDDDDDDDVICLN